VIVTLLEVGGVVGQQYLGPVDTATLSAEQKDRIEKAVEAADFDLDPPDPTNVPVRELKVTRNGEEESASWRVDESPPWSGGVVAALEAVTDWQLGQPDQHAS
jgi:hypothetical protein